ncbi:MAG TPA: hypothetical protein VHV49_07510 [Pseudonocardiaceae bacterium]|nr:hypothetical protein [Pseudonocardiaceae bacterium]
MSDPQPQWPAAARTSDEILDPGARGMDYFTNFIPAYREWTGDAPDLGRDIHDVYDKLRGIQFAKFHADAARLSTSHGKLVDSALNLATATGSLGGFWAGEAAEAAQRYCGSFGQHAQAVADGVHAAGQVITSAVRAIESAVRQRAQGVLSLDATDIGGVPVAGVRQLVDIAKHQASDDVLRSVAAWPAFQQVDWGDTDCGGTLSQNVKNLAAQDAAKWLNGTFVPHFDQRKQSFDSITKSTHDSVSQSFAALNQGLTRINANPFAGLNQDIQVTSVAAGGAARPAATSPPPAAAPPPAVVAPPAVAPPAAAPEPVGATDPFAMQATTLSAAPDAGLGGGVATGGSLDGGNGNGDVAGAVLDGGQAVASHMVAAHHHDLFGGVVTPPGHAGVAGTDVTPMGQPGDAGLASAPDSALNQGGAAGMPMMGGMGGGAGQGDQQRAVQHQWRTFGQLFDDAGDDSIGRFSGTLDDGR